MLTINDLPEEMLFCIFSHLTRADIEIVKEVSVQWYRVATDKMLSDKFLPPHSIDDYFPLEKGCLCSYCQGLRDNERQEHFVDNKIKKQYYLKDSEPEGEYKEWYRNGTLKRGCYYHKTKNKGKYKGYHNNGQLFFEGYLKDDNNNVINVRYSDYNNGLDIIWGMWEGDFKQWNEYGDLVVECYYKNGKLEGKKWDYEVVSCPQRSISCKVRTNAKINPLGARSIRIYLSHYTNGVKNGIEKVWQNNGTLLKSCNYKNGTLDGNLKEWNHDGRMIKKCSYDNGILDNKYTEWYTDGHIKKKCYYKNGKLEGKYKVFNTKGRLIEYNKYKNGLLDGNCYKLDGIGTIKSHILYKDGYKKRTIVREPDWTDGLSQVVIFIVIISIVYYLWSATK